MPKPPPGPYAHVERHLARRDPVLKSIIGTHGACTLKPNPDHFGALVRAILSQQISTRAAETIGQRLRQLCGRKDFNSRSILAATDDELRACGISASKRRSLRSLSEFASSRSAFVGMQELSDTAVAARLLPLHGIGPWTVDMFLIFSLGRLDVLPVSDLGLRAGVKKLHGLPEIPTPAEVTRLAECWKPYRSIGTWYCWRSLENKAAG